MKKIADRLLSGSQDSKIVCSQVLKIDKKCYNYCSIF
jgi:hypothetical protein